MNFSTWVAYLAVSYICVATPGPSTLFVVSNSIVLGWRRIIFSSLGNISGVFLVSSLTMIGLGTLLKTSVLLFSILKIIGGGYLIYLGFRQWNSKINIFSYLDDELSNKKNKITNLQLFLKGLLIAITNPKAILFFSALFPQFIKTENNLLPQFIILTVTFMFCSFSCSMTYAYTATSVKKWFSSSNRINWFNHISGSIFILLGINILRLKNKQT